ncbi:MAG: type II toxin-antitoxin system Phd/YefM family antitoxin [Trueperaceae bacterium]
MLKLEGRIRSISTLKARAAELIRELNERQEPLVITQNGEARAVLLDVATFDQLQETSALLKMLSLADRQSDEGMVQPADEALTAFEGSEG